MPVVIMDLRLLVPNSRFAKNITRAVVFPETVNIHLVFKIHSEPRLFSTLFWLIGNAIVSRSPLPKL